MYLFHSLRGIVETKIYLSDRSREQFASIMKLREIMTGLDAISILDRSGGGIKFNSSRVPPTKRIEVALLLYLCNMSIGDMQDAVGAAGQ